MYSLALVTIRSSIASPLLGTTTRNKPRTTTLAVSSEAENYRVTYFIFSKVSEKPKSPLSSPARQRAARQDLPLSRDASQGYSSRLRDSFLQQILDCLAVEQVAQRGCAVFILRHLHSCVESGLRGASASDPAGQASSMLCCEVLRAALANSCDTRHGCLVCKYTTGASEHGWSLQWSQRGFKPEQKALMARRSVKKEGEEVFQALVKPLQPLVKTMVRQAVPLQPMGVNGGADIHLQPMEDPTLEQVDA
ncbi:hypothetical protein QYF61_027122 [Mycteria americana]|uniref:Uncharacterized protein n=1 Tax=Mycteria americana TaxID=33587 RepID=A0AAN7NJ79_MYCAM|nr:hypothetical protein QYF61_027122 [Mycteria americana]